MLMAIVFINSKYAYNSYEKLVLNEIGLKTNGWDFDDERCQNIGQIAKRPCLYVI